MIGPGDEGERVSFYFQVHVLMFFFVRNEIGRNVRSINREWKYIYMCMWVQELKYIPVRMYVVTMCLK